MDELMIVANVAIVFGVMYKLFELFAGRKERMMLIEKLSDKLTPELLGKGPMYLPTNMSFSGLRLGCLLVGLGLGLLVGFFIVDVALCNYWEEGDVSIRMHDASSVVYGACVLLFGGAGLLVSYLIENRCRK